MDDCPKVRGHMAKFCRSIDGASAVSPTTPSNLSQCVASAVFSVVPESLLSRRRLSVAGLALAEVLQEEELSEVSYELRYFWMYCLLLTCIASPKNLPFYYMHLLNGCTEISFILRSRFGEVCSCCS